MNRMISYALALLAMQPMIALAQNFTGYRTTTLDTVVEEWNEKTNPVDMMQRIVAAHSNRDSAAAIFD